METLRFLMVTTFYPPYHLGGDAVHVQYLARALAAKGHEVHVEFSPAAYALKRKSPGAADQDAHDGVHRHAIPGARRTQPVAAHLLGRSGVVRRFHAKLLADLHPDVIHHHNISLLGLDVLDGGNGARSLYTAHDYWVRCPRNDLFKYGRYACDTPTCVRCLLSSGRPPQLWRYGSRWRGLPQVDCAIAPSRYMARAIQPAIDCPVVHIPNFAPDSDPSQRERADEGYYLFVGVLESHKGISELVTASLRKSFPIRIVGRGSLQQRLAERANGGTPSVQLEGWVPHDRLVSLYRGAKALIVPSLWPENAPLAAVEALSCGTPLLVSRRGGLEEMLHDGAAGFSFEPGPEGIAEAVDRFENTADPARLRSGARHAYEEFHHPDAYLRRYLELASVEGSREMGPTAGAGPSDGSAAGGWT